MAHGVHLPPAATPASRAPIERVIQPFLDFAAVEGSSGILLMLATAAALIWANSPWANSYQHFWHTPVTAGFGEFVLEGSLHHWINDGLMAVFFFTVGLEIKREVLVGELSDGRQALLPIAAAVGGMLVPAALYLAVNSGGPEAHGWGIPMATDIAFALGILAMLGKRVPVSLKVFLTALAIADDLGAVLVIAIFYTTELHLAALAAALVIFLVMLAMNRLGVRQPIPYWLLGMALWAAFLKSGIHATIGGVLAAMTIPASTRIDCGGFVAGIRELLAQFEGSAGERGCLMLSNREQHTIVLAMKKARYNIEPPLQRLEQAHHPWVAFLVMPVFALANAGVDLSGLPSALLSPMSLGIVLGLVAGKQAGIMAVAWVLRKTGLAGPPQGATWRHLYGAACLCGIGFTMSIFVAGLAVEGPELLEEAKLGILAASVLSGVLGYLVLAGAPPPEEGRG